ncbi:hypothetical protein SUDANB19_00245 [Streptomyces sp. enrichment culture]
MPGPSPSVVLRIASENTGGYRQGMRIVVDREKCTSCGSCAMYSPELFDQDEKDGRVLLIVERPSGSQEKEVREAVLRCPTGAIELVEE